jgi:aryl-alcohol dehydrogenase-like predicted oxidoreductase
MDYRRLGRTGLKVSEICLGTMTFGHGADQAGTERILATCFDAGVNFVDTANAYNAGVSETMLGKALGAKRKQTILASKVFNPMGPGPNDSGMSRSHILEAVEGSLKRLNTDYLDLYYIHHVDIETPLEEMLRAFDDLVRSGKVRYIACSNYECWRLMEALWISDSRGWERFAAHQPQYSLVVRDIEEEIVPACELKGVGVVCWSPLAGGFLGGKYKPGEAKVAGTRSDEGWAYPSKYFSANADKILAALLAAAGELGRSPAEVALRWVLDRPFMTSAIVGARDAAQAAQSMKAAGWRLPKEIDKRLDEISAPPPRYPRSMETGMDLRRANAVKMPGMKTA